MTTDFLKLDVDPALRSRRTTSDYVAEALRAAILAGRFEDGQELNQVELADHFGVSRVPVREALRQLQAEGLIEAQAHRRAVVTGFSPERILEMFELRMLLEGFLLEKAAPNIDGDASRGYARCATRWTPPGTVGSGWTRTASFTPRSTSLPAPRSRSTSTSS